MIMGNKISNEDLQALREDIQKERKAYYKGEYRHGWLAMIDNCLGELQDFRTNAKSVTIDLPPKVVRKIMEKAVNEVLKDIIIKCPDCRKEINLGEILTNSSGRSEDKEEQPKDIKEQ